MNEPEGSRLRDKKTAKRRNPPKNDPMPRIWSPAQTAARLNRSVQWLYEHMPRLTQLGFPRRDNELGGWDSKAVEAWIDARSNPVRNIAMEDEMLEAARGQGQTTLCQ